MIRLIAFIVVLFLNIPCHAQDFSALKSAIDKEVQNRRFISAISLTQQLMKLQPDEYSSYMNRAYCNYELKEYKKAIADCNKALILKPDVWYEYYLVRLRGISFFELAMWEEARRDFVYYTNVNNKDIGGLTNLANSLYELKRYSESIKIYSSILKIDNIDTTNIIETYASIGFCYARLDSLEKSKEFVKKITRLDSSNVSANYLNAVILYDLGDFKGAMEEYTEILKSDSSDLLVYFYRGKTKNRLSKYNDALKDLRRYKPNNKRSADFHYEIATAEEGLRNFPKAIENFKYCVNEKPESSSYCNSLAWAYYLNKNYLEGLTYANKAIQIDTTNDDAFDTRGCLYYKLGKIKESISDFNTAIRLNLNYFNSYYFRGHAFFKLGEKEKACSDWSFLLDKKDYEVKNGEKSIETLIQENCKG